MNSKSARVRNFQIFLVRIIDLNKFQKKNNNKQTQKPQAKFGHEQNIVL